MKTLKIAILTATVAAVATAAAITAYREIPTYAEPNIDTAYTCASIHFGMSDATLTGYVTSYGAELSQGTEKKSLVSTLAPGVGIESFKVTEDSLAPGSLLVAGGDYKVNKKTYYATNTHGLKLGNSNNGATLSIKLSATAIGCDIYAVGWKESGVVSISVNGSDAVSVPKNESITGTMAPDTLTVTYNKYTFAFDASNTITIVTAKRAIIGDIAFRLL